MREQFFYEESSPLLSIGSFPTMCKVDFFKFRLGDTGQQLQRPRLEITWVIKRLTLRIQCVTDFPPSIAVTRLFNV